MHDLVERWWIFNAESVLCALVYGHERNDFDSSAEGFDSDIDFRGWLSF